MKKTSKNDGFSGRLRTKRDPIKVRLLVVMKLVMRHLLHHQPKKSKDPVKHPSLYCKIQYFRLSENCTLVTLHKMVQAGISAPLRKLLTVA